MKRPQMNFLKSVSALLPAYLVLALSGVPAHAHHKPWHGTTTTTTTTPSGEPIPVGDRPGWKHIFADDFTTDVPLGSFPEAVKEKWWAYLDGWSDTSKLGTHYPSKVVSIANGKMNLKLHTENGVTMVAAPQPRINGYSGGGGDSLADYNQLYGRYAVRFRADAVAGFKTAWLLWPQSEVWPRDGEIDFPEGNLDGNIGAFMHRQDGVDGGDQDVFFTTATYPRWHTAVTEWGPNEVRFILDGVTIGVSTSRIPNTPMRWVLQSETAMDGTIPSPTAVANVEIDWVSAWAYSG